MGAQHLALGVQMLLGHVKKSDGNRGTLEISDGDKCFEQWFVHDMDKWQTMPTECSFKRVRGALGVVELRKLLIKHVLSDATDDHVQVLASSASSTKIIWERWAAWLQRTP